MLAAVLAAAAIQAAPPPTLATNTGDWVLARVQRVIAPENMPGQCFVQAQVEQVVHGDRYRAGQPVYISLACRRGGLTPTAMPLDDQRPGQGLRSAPRAMQTIEALRRMKRVVVRLDASSRVVDNQYYGVGAQPLDAR